MMPLISVIVPVYKVEPYLHRCVDSILKQTFTDFELILVDDGSPDNCGAICDEYARKDNRIIVIHQENGGLSSARNAGIDWSFANSDSQWLTFIDSDDWVHPQYLEVLYKAVCDNNSKVSVCSFVMVDDYKDNFESLAVNALVVDTKSFYLQDRTNFIIACGKLYAKECFRNIRYPIGKIHEDEFTTYKILFEYDNIAFISDNLYYYFRNPNGIMSSSFSLKKYDGIIAREERISFFNKLGYDDIVEKEEIINTFEVALFSIFARKSNMYHKVPTEYRISWLKAMLIIKKSLSKDEYEWIMHPYYPTLVKIYSYYHKIKSLFKRKL